MSIAKNAATVFISVAAFHDTFKAVQIICFVISLLLIGLHGFMKMYKSDFDQGFDVGFMAMTHDLLVWCGLAEPKEEEEEEADHFDAEEPLIVNKQEDSLISTMSNESVQSKRSWSHKLVAVMREASNFSHRSRQAD